MDMVALTDGGQILWTGTQRKVNHLQPVGWQASLQLYGTRQSHWRSRWMPVSGGPVNLVTKHCT